MVYQPYIKIQNYIVQNRYSSQKNVIILIVASYCQIAIRFIHKQIRNQYFSTHRVKNVVNFNFGNFTHNVAVSFLPRTQILLNKTKPILLQTLVYDCICIHIICIIYASKSNFHFNSHLLYCEFYCMVLTIKRRVLYSTYTMCTYNDNFYCIDTISR